MDHLAEQLKVNGIDLAWWPLFLGSYREELSETRALKAANSEDSLTTCMRGLGEVVADFEETLP